MVALVLGLCVYFPFQLAFEDVHPVRTAAWQHRTTARPLLRATRPQDAFRWTPALDAALTAFFAVDIALNFRTGYVGDKTGTVVMEPRLVARRYARTWLVLDVVATVPWDLVARAADAGEPSSAALFPRLLRAVRLYRLAKLIRLFRLLRAFKLREMFKDTLEDLNIDRNYLSLLKLLGTVRGPPPPPHLSARDPHYNSLHPGSASGPPPGLRLLWCRRLCRELSGGDVGGGAEPGARQPRAALPHRPLLHRGVANHHRLR